jgi:hypothetical protein
LIESLFFNALLPIALIATPTIGNQEVIAILGNMLCNTKTHDQK